MSGSVNKVILVGHLGADPEIRYTPQGAAVANLRLATNESWKNKNGQREDRTEWHRVILWSKLGELAGQYLKKGSQVFIEGRLQTRSWDDKDGQKRYSTEIVATSMQFLGGRSDGASRRVDTSGADMPSDIPPPMGDFGGSQEDDIPF